MALLFFFRNFESDEQFSIEDKHNLIVYSIWLAFIIYDFLYLRVILFYFCTKKIPENFDYSKQPAYTEANLVMNYRMYNPNTVLIGEERNNVHF